MGSADSSVTILQLSEGLVEMQHNEKNIISSVGGSGLQHSTARQHGQASQHAYRAHAWMGMGTL